MPSKRTHSRGIWTATIPEAELLYGYLVTEARGRLAEPVALIHTEFDKPHQNLMLHRMERVAQRIAADPSVIDIAAGWVVDLRGRRNLLYEWLQRYLYRDGPYVGRFLSGDVSVVYSRRAPGVDPDAKAQPIERDASGRLKCPHCAYTCRGYLRLEHHVEKAHADAMTCSLLLEMNYGVWRDRHRRPPRAEREAAQ